MQAVELWGVGGSGEEVGGVIGCKGIQIPTRNLDWMWLIVSGLALCEAMGLVFRR